MCCLINIIMDKSGTKYEEEISVHLTHTNNENKGSEILPTIIITTCPIIIRYSA